MKDIFDIAMARKFGGGGGSKPEGTIQITENGTHDVTEYASAEVMVQSGDGYDVLNALIERSITEVSGDCEIIGSNAFNLCNKLTSANFPIATKIGTNAFASCTKLNSVFFPNVTEIGNGAFTSNNKIPLKNVDFPSAVTVGDKAFENCQFESMNFPLLKVVEQSTFGRNANLSSAYLPSATKIESYGFQFCTNLQTVDFPSLTTTDGYVFTGCTKLATANLPLLATAERGLFKDCSSLTSVELSSITSLPSETFYGCTNLTIVVLGGENVVPLASTTAFSGTPFQVGKTGGMAVCPQSLIEQYKIETNWSILYEAGTVTFVAKEGSIYE